MHAQKISLGPKIGEGGDDKQVINLIWPYCRNSTEDHSLVEWKSEKRKGWGAVVDPGFGKGGFICACA